MPTGGSFDDMVAPKGDNETGDKTNKIIAELAEVSGLRRVTDQADFNDKQKLGRGKEMQLRTHRGWPLRPGNQACLVDLSGDA